MGFQFVKYEDWPEDAKFAYGRCFGLFNRPRSTGVFWHTNGHTKTPFSELAFSDEACFGPLDRGGEKNYTNFFMALVPGEVENKAGEFWLKHLFADPCPVFGENLTKAFVVYLDKQGVPRWLSVSEDKEDLTNATKQEFVSLLYWARQAYEYRGPSRTFKHLVDGLGFSPAHAFFMSVPFKSYYYHDPDYFGTDLFYYGHSATYNFPWKMLSPESIVGGANSANATNKNWGIPITERGSYNGASKIHGMLQGTPPLFEVWANQKECSDYESALRSLVQSPQRVIIDPRVSELLGLAEEPEKEGRAVARLNVELFLPQAKDSKSYRKVLLSTPKLLSALLMLGPPPTPIFSPKTEKTDDTLQPAFL